MWHRLPLPHEILNLVSHDQVLFLIPHARSRFFGLPERPTSTSARSARRNAGTIKDGLVFNAMRDKLLNKEGNDGKMCGHGVTALAIRDRVRIELEQVRELPQ